MTVTIYHNPRCATSRKALAMIRESGVEPDVIEYMKNPPSRARLKELIAAMGGGTRAAIRRKEKIYSELGLDASGESDDELLDAMLAHPILIDRPIVATRKGVRLCRPAELVHELI